VTEIPEHLLKRSRDRKSGDSAASGEPAGASGENVPAVQKAATPAKAVKNEPSVVVAKPDTPRVAAAKSRKKIPFWAMATLSLLPLWAFLYAYGVKPQVKEVEGPLAIGSEIYGGCAGCHGAAGQGGAGRILHQGEVLKTFPHIEDMLNFVYNGSSKYVAAGLDVYGDPDREGGAHAMLSYNGNPMPQQGEKAGGALTEYQILGVVCHIRYDLSGADPDSEEWAAEYNTWCSPDSEIFTALQDGATSFDTVDKDFAMLENAPRFVGTEPRPMAK
jgi:mono/diheme cytochrome c family protein